MLGGGVGSSYHVVIIGRNAIVTVIITVAYAVYSGVLLS